MNILSSIQKRFLMFLIGCIGVRTLFVFMAKSWLPDGIYLKMFAAPLFIMGLGFLSIWVLGLRKTGRETFGEKIWWNSLRPIHSVLYLSAAVLLFTQKRELAWKLLAVDVSIGFISFIINHISAGSFSLLLD